MLLATATIAAKAYSLKYGEEVKVVEETGNQYQWYAGNDLEGLEQDEEFVGIVETFPASNKCPHCEEGKVYRQVSIRYSGNWIPDEKQETCQECDGNGHLE